MENKNKYNTSTEDDSLDQASVNELDQTAVNEIDDIPGTEPVEPLVDEIAQFKRELDEQKDKYLRLVAEFDNFKRRNAKERMELIQTAGKDVIVSMLDVLDDFDRAEKQMNTDDIEQIKAGVQLVLNKFRTTLQSKGLKPMESIDTEFDVHKHEAIAEVPVENEDKKGKVIDEIVKGYYLNDKLIRFAKVIVGK